MDKVAIYCRLSKEDLDKLNKGDESASIQNQKMLLVDYANNHDMQIYKIYSDDDYGGSDHTRPQWNQMLIDAENGKFNIILCKTQSRFARDMEVVEKYIHGLFIEWGIRFISIVDNIDTQVKSSKKTSQINGLVDQWYLEDLSQNIREIYRAKMEKGEFLGAFAPYGYMKDPKNKYKLIIDEEAAEVVRKIFDLSLQGYGVDRICQILTAMGIPTPTEYKQTQGLTFKCPTQNYTKKGIWSTTTVKRILNNPVYIGTLIQGREKKVSYKSKKVIITPKDEWVIIENNHEPIISKEIFDKTQELFKVRRKTCKSTAGKKFVPHLFSGKIKCADCHSTMAKTSGRLAGGYDYFICQLAKKSKSTECTRHSVRYDSIEKYVESRIKEVIEKMLGFNNNKESIRQYFKKDQDNSKKINDLKNSLNKIDNQIDDINKAISNLYIDKIKNIITENEFIMLKDNFNKELTALKNQKNLIEEELHSLSLITDKVDAFSEAVNRHMNFDKLTFQIVNDFIECIYVHEKDAEGNQEIEIHWNI